MFENPAETNVKCCHQQDINTKNNCLIKNQQSKNFKHAQKISRVLQNLVYGTYWYYKTVEHKELYHVCNAYHKSAKYLLTWGKVQKGVIFHTKKNAVIYWYGAGVV